MPPVKTYTLIAPVYDALVRPLMRSAREQSLKQLAGTTGADILIPGIGSGLDIPLLPKGNRYTGLDANSAMLAKAKHAAREAQADVELLRGNAMSLPFASARFDWIILHLILAVVPNPALVLTEAQRVLKPSGRVLIFDKFLRPGQRALFRRLINPLASRIATRTDVVFEDVLTHVQDLRLVSDRPGMSDGWFRSIVLEKT